jgi:uncharacterized protein YbbK (DUF523 family)
MTETPQELVLVSACLAGRACRYDGSAGGDDEVAALVREGRAILVCPEVEGGLGTPRPPAEITGGDGADVLAGSAKVLTEAGEDVTEKYLSGARSALQLARERGVGRAILKARSPSCGHGAIYDGTFSGKTVPGEGVTAALLISEGIVVMSEEGSRAEPTSTSKED